MYWEQEKEKKTKQTINYKFIDLNLKNMSFPSGSELMKSQLYIAMQISWIFTNPKFRVEEHSILSIILKLVGRGMATILI
jgi:hypothetical protein